MNPLAVTTAYVSFGLLLVFTCIRWLFGSSNDKYRHLPLPPGPARLPILGNLLEAPTSKPFKHWLALSKTYGPVMYIDIAGQPLVLLHSNEAAQDLLAKRAARYSDRPRMPLLELMEDAGAYGAKFIVGRQYDSTFRLHHRMLASGMTSTCAPRFQALMQLETAQMVRDLLREGAVAGAGAGTISSKTVETHFSRMQGSVVLGLLYSMRFATADDPVLVENEDVLRDLGNLGRGSPVLQLFPSLTRLPAFLSPWAGPARAVRARETPLATRNLAAGLEAPGWNLAKQATDIASRNGIPDTELAYTLYESAVAGMESTPQALLWVLVALLHQPCDAIARAQEVLDRVVGRGRLPTFADRADLAYVDAIIYETMRWRPVAPDGVPHRCVAGDEYKGMRIPPNTLVLANTWGLGREEAIFGGKRDGSTGRWEFDVEEFIPERWLEKEEGSDKLRFRTDLPIAIFGFGRRTCVGRRIAEDGVFVAVARLLWAFTIRAAGVRPDPDGISPTALTVSPAVFDLELKPRGDWVSGVVEREWAALEKAEFVVTGRYDGYTEPKTA
ncbi:hypothetical protein SLS62_008872 [Diatrype stigma]|uniref:Cytochrome P450 n=1 Tax=Diatrype stigma TaxID=117547 RepID=A0AAN9US52_9PEZI